ncbi:hypothetical protein KIN20_037978 [Parelaphostrongylus tenuis]|uniref:Uncharacterized protein n=1 Tax=Parelaphostrongylus tenuis TaxID=148309 RepID=A0AAD5RE99_PARTN|nr:hypothetical protein KIN20_037978 [Parelaphostrongylus tenuis]
MLREKDGKVLGEEDWEAFEDEELELMLQGLAGSADEDAGNESVESIDKNADTTQGSEDDDDETDDALRAP